MASAEVASGVFPELRKKALQDLLEFVKNAVSSQEDTSKTVDLEQGELLNLDLFFVCLRSETMKMYVC